MKLSSGKAHYIGDFSGHVRVITGANGWGNYEITSWNLRSWKNNYRETTEELKEKFANFAAVSTEDLMQDAGQTLFK